ncbi:hypothetical protein AB205_0052730, partial [Aquarana catesbeiana]
MAGAEISDTVTRQNGEMLVYISISLRRSRVSPQQSSPRDPRPDSRSSRRTCNGTAANLKGHKGTPICPAVPFCRCTSVCASREPVKNMKHTKLGNLQSST